MAKGMTKIPATQKSLDLLRADPRFTLVEVVERHVPFPQPHGRKVDLFHMFDILALGRGMTLAVQTTSATNFANRCAKLAEMRCTDDHCPAAGTDHLALSHAIEAGWTPVVHGWDRVSKGKSFRYELTRHKEFQIDEREPLRYQTGGE